MKTESNLMSSNTEHNASLRAPDLSKKKKQMDALTLSNPLIAGVALLFEAWASKYFGFEVIAKQQANQRTKRNERHNQIPSAGRIRRGARAVSRNYSGYRTRARAWRAHKALRRDLA